MSPYYAIGNIKPFVLSCVLCDAGDGLENAEQARAAGWSDIEQDFGGTSWNNLGVCPDCHEAWFGEPKSS
jgi:hypothetical protein